MQRSRRNPLDLGHPGQVFIIVALAVLVVDQITKAYVRSHFVVGESLTLIPHLLHLTLVHNVGAAFGLFPGRQPVFMLTSTLVLGAIAVFWARTRPREWPVVVALALVTAGAVGNLIDRALIGQVTDFFEFGFIDFPVFNVADIGIVGGVIVLAAWILFGPVEAQPAETPADNTAKPPTDESAGNTPCETAPSESTEEPS